MAWKKLLGLATSVALVSVAALAGNGCSSSSGGATGGDAGSSSGVVHHEAGAGSSSGGTTGDAGDDGGTTIAADGTSGKPCTTDADCHSATGPGVNKCSNGKIFTLGQLFPTPVCIVPPSSKGNCDPGQDGNIHYCDGPDLATSPGVCLPNGSNTVGICLPQCTFKADGSAASGCQGKDACNVYGFGQDTTTQAVTGVGYCFGGCETDADCQTGQKCQTDQGICVNALATGELAVGTGCNAAASPAPACNCIAATSNNLGYCAQYCKVGGVACPTGSTCDANLPTTLTGANDATVAGFTSQNGGLSGFCGPKCTIDGGSTCPTNSTCQNVSVAGPDCVP